MPLPLNTLYDSSNLNLTVDDLYDKCKSMCDRMTISCHEQSMIYDCTKAQSSSMTWFEQRIGRVSSSVVYRVLHTSIEKPSTSLLMQICNPSTAPINTRPILWGRQQEQVTLKEYSQIVSPEHQNFSITKTGFLIDQEHPFIGVSADSISTCEYHGKRTRTSLQTQIVASMIATNWNYRIHIIVRFSYKCRCMMWVIVTKSVFVMCILPELLTRQLQHTKERYCIKRQFVLYMPNTWGCDNVNCKYQWFHLDCINMKQVPKSVWYCHFCKQ